MLRDYITIYHLLNKLNSIFFKCFYQIVEHYLTVNNIARNIREIMAVLSMKGWPRKKMAANVRLGSNTLGICI